MDLLFAPGDLAPWISAALAVLIGVLFGAERETARTTVHIGLRDFVAVSVVAHVCAIIGSVWITIAVVALLAALITVHHMRASVEAGITTEVAMVATFVLAYVVSMPQEPQVRQLGLALAVMLVLLLDAKPLVKRFFRETVTEVEFADTIKFLALIFVIYPLLPDGRFGPYGAIAPRSLWMAVLVVSGISFIGYFLEKFLGPRAGIRAAAVLGGMVSTTAATQAFAQRARSAPERTADYARAAMIANAIQFLRVNALLAIVWPDMALRMIMPLTGAAAAGLIAGFLRPSGSDMDERNIDVSNPLRILPALKFAFFLGLVTLGSAWAVGVYGGGALMWTSALAGIVDVDAVVLSAADHVTAGNIGAQVASWSIIIAILSNAMVKSTVAFTSGTPGYGKAVSVGMAIMLAICALLTVLIG
jgi:uncharacterized membrane protein (DUF4010 family)